MPSQLPRPPLAETTPLRRVLRSRARGLWRAAEPVRAHVGFALCLLAYHRLVMSRTLPPETSLLFTEVPLALGAFATLHAFARRSRARAVLAAAPLLLAYAAHDYHLWLFARPLEWRDAGKLTELLGVLSPLAALALCAALLAIPAVLALHLDPRALRTRRLLWLTPWLGLAALLALAPRPIVEASESTLQLTRWSSVQNVSQYGRLFMSVVRGAEHHVALAAVGGAKALETSARYVTPQEHGAFARRNVHLIVLESFMDASLFEAARFSPAPMHPELTSLMGTARSVSYSPYVAGCTAESEFELLCGAPSLGLMQEFKMMTGAPTYCLPRVLAELGYEAVAYHPCSRVMYNRTRAYPSLGFARQHFLDSPPSEAPLPQPAAGTQHVLDTDLYDELLSRLRARGDASRPLFSYVLTMEGHTPFHLDANRQPRVVQVEPPDATLEVLANKTYYRSQALARYVRALVELDPEALIVAVADHLPPIMDGGRDFYRRFGYRGRYPAAADAALEEQFLLIVDAGRVRNVEPLQHFDVYALILDTLSSGAYCARRRCSFGAATPTEEQRADSLSILAAGIGR